jgi:uncharacterized protein
MYQATDPVTKPDEIKEILGEDFPSQTNKVIDHIDEHCRKWIERSPFIVISSTGASGAMDISPKGDPVGFVQVLDAHTLAIPDRIGNHRGDTFINVIENPNVAIMFVVPNRREVVRVTGTAQVVRDPALLDSMIVNQHRPDLALLVRVSEAFFHCGKSMIRSNMWAPEKWGPVDGLPTYGEALKDHANLQSPIELINEAMDDNEKHRLY